MSDDEARVATPSQTVGPFFHFALTQNSFGSLRDRLTQGRPIRLIVRIVDGDGQPVDDAMVELSQDGAFGRMPTGEDGACEFETVHPGTSPARTDGQAPHVSVHIFARGLLRHLHARIYFEGDPALANDPVLRLIPEARRVTLLARPDPASPDQWTFAVRLQGPGETVFFNA